MTKEIDALAARAERDRVRFEPPADPPDEERAMQFLQEGVGPAVWVYVEAHSGETDERLDPSQFRRLEGAMNDWLELYTRCYGVDLNAQFTVREAAELLLQTHNVRDVAQLLTHVPERECVG